MRSFLEAVDIKSLIDNQISGEGKSEAKVKNYYVGKNSYNEHPSSNEEQNNRH